jgi:hypothetical protein
MSNRTENPRADQVQVQIHASHGGRQPSDIPAPDLRPPAFELGELHALFSELRGQLLAGQLRCVGNRSSLLRDAPARTTF